MAGHVFLVATGCVCHFGDAVSLDGSAGAPQEGIPFPYVFSACRWWLPLEQARAHGPQPGLEQGPPVPPALPSSESSFPKTHLCPSDVHSQEPLLLACLLA